MADLIDRQAAIDAMRRLEQEDIEAYGVKIPEGFDAEPAVEALKALPSAQPEIIRCKDCQWFDMTDPCGTLAPNSNRCKRVARLWMEDDEFCAYGERRDDGNG